MKSTYRIYHVMMSLIVGVTLATAFSGCKNTAHGAGEDIEDMGEKIQQKAD